MTLSITDLTKSYAANRVLDGVDMQVQAGEVHALLGPNGAGKSTLIKCLGGAVKPDSGTIVVNGEDITGKSPSEAFEYGIATIHQHLSLVENISVADNLFYGRERKRFGIVARREQHRIAKELLADHQISLKPTAQVSDLPIALRQRVEIVKAWSRTSITVLILDEPTAAISARDSEILFERIEEMRNSGVAIIYTTHRMAEVFRIADNVTVLNNGAVGLQAAVADLTPERLISAIAGPNSATSSRKRARPDQGREPALQCEDLEGSRFGPISFHVGAGEVVGVFGAVGSGRTSLLETLAGAYRTDDLHGTVRLDGKRYVPSSPGRAIRSGVRFVASDRARQGLWGTLAAKENVLMSRYPKLAKGGLRDRRRESTEFTGFAQQLALVPDDPGKPAEQFSGGNQQKLVVGRTGLGASGTRLLILDEPTQGVDVGSRAKIYDFIEKFKEEHQCGVLVASSEPDELMLLCDRVLVMADGVLADVIHRENFSENALMATAHQFTK